MSIETGEQCWSSNNEDFNCDSLEELLERISDDDEIEAGRVVYVGTKSTPDAAKFISGPLVIEQMGEWAYEVGGEFAEDFPDVTSEAKAELDDLLKAWARKHCEVRFFTVHNVKEYVLTVEDIAAFRGKEPAA